MQSEPSWLEASEFGKMGRTDYIHSMTISKSEICTFLKFSGILVNSHNYLRLVRITGNLPAFITN